jgi:hypothetical protein
MYQGIPSVSRNIVLSRLAVTADGVLACCVTAGLYPALGYKRVMQADKSVALCKTAVTSGVKILVP